MYNNNNIICVTQSNDDKTSIGTHNHQIESKLYDQQVFVLMLQYWASRHKAISFNIFFLPIETYRVNKIIVYVSPHIDLAGPG